MRLLTPLFANAAMAVLPIMACCCLAALTANLLQSGFLYSLQPVTPDFSRVNPINGARRILSLRGFGELVKALLKLTLLTSVAFFYLRGRLPDVAMLAATHGLSALGEIAATIWGLVLRMGMVMAIIAGADYLFQRRMHEQNLRMSKHDLKEEFRRHEGDPQLKAQLRRRQQEIARGRMLHNVSKATVVVTNPVHVAVALRYEPDEMPAPVLVAKGQRRMAERIREEARRHRVPILERAPLARALFKAVEIGDPVPTALYQAVAEIIAFVYRLSGRHHTADQR
jgi:flagellar biosynthetic protein FlhB